MQEESRKRPVLHSNTFSGRGECMGEGVGEGVGEWMGGDVLRV